MARSLIGITGQLEAAHWGDWVREAVLSPVSYTRAVERAGGTPVVLPPVPPASVARLVAGLDGLVLTGGPDLDPEFYGAAPHGLTDASDSRRDRFELSLARAAIEAQLPVLGIGRGLQVLSVARGGSLVQHLPDAVRHHGHAPDRFKMTQEDIRLLGSSRLGKLLGPWARVPALHHQAIQQIGDGLVPVAWAADQVIEAVEMPDHRFAVGVQWHPEEGDDLRVFEALAFAAASPAGQGAGGREGGPGEDARIAGGRDGEGARGNGGRDSPGPAPAGRDAGPAVSSVAEPPGSAVAAAAGGPARNTEGRKAGTVRGARS